MKICVYAISKNEEQFVQRFCEAAKDADLILVADTGSTDRTVELLHEFRNVAVPRILIKPWRFDLARNAALALLPNDIDVCVSLDLDEVLQPGWRAEIERVWKVGETTRMRYMFDWGAGIAFKYEKIHGRWGYKWHHPCHEYPMPFGITENWADSDKLLVIHKPDPTKSRAQYLPLLKMSIEEDPYCPRNAFYYARELSFTSQWAESVKECERYLALPRATWPNERCYARRVMGRCYVELGQLANAEAAFRAAAKEASNTREPWFELSALMYKQQRWVECLDFASKCLAILDREKVYTVDPVVWGAQPHDYAAIAAYRLGLKGLAVDQAKLAVQKDPTDPRYQANLKFCEAMTVPEELK
jgi:glycosyltransferase involved in cell wall biosynthesis